MLHWYKITARPQLFVVKQRLGSANGRIWKAQHLRAFEQLVAAIILDPLIEYVKQMLGMCRTIDDILPFRRNQVLGLSVAGHPFDERGPVAKRAMHNIAVAAFANPKIAAPMKRAAARLNPPFAEKAAGDVLDRGRGGFLHAEIDPLTGALALTRKESTHRADCAVIRRTM